MAALTLTNDSSPGPTAKVRDRPLTAQIYPKPIRDRPLTAQIYPKPIVELSIPVGR